MGKGRGGRHGHTRQDLRAGKRAAAEQRNAAYAALTTKQKIDGLDPTGAARQRAKLTVLLFSEKEAAKALKAEKAAEKAAAKSEKK